MKYRIIKCPFNPQKILAALCCLNCDKPMLRIEKGIKTGRQLGDDGWYCLKCGFFFFERNGVMYYCEVSYDRITDTFVRYKDEHFAIFLKNKPPLIE